MDIVFMLAQLSHAWPDFTLLNLLLAPLPLSPSDLSFPSPPSSPSSPHLPFLPISPLSPLSPFFHPRLSSH